jgi:hypothetical protein
MTWSADEFRPVTLVAIGAVEQALELARSSSGTAFIEGAGPRPVCLTR